MRKYINTIATNPRDPTRIAHVASADSMAIHNNSPSDSPGSNAQSPLIFTHQVCDFCGFWCVQLKLENFHGYKIFAQ
jgi:hypothetical protein